MRFESIPRQSLARAVSELAAKGVRKLLVTSAGSGDGKSSVVAALGSALAIAEQASVALVDADAYKPTLHRAFGLGVEYGLGELLEELYWVDLAHETPAQFGLGDWIELLRAQQRTGELKVSDATQAFTLRFVKGVLGSIAERTAADPYRLGELLVANGRISAVQLEQALVVQFETGRPLGDVLC